MRDRFRTAKLFAVTALALMTYAVDSAAQLTLATGADADVTGDGLHRVDPSIMGAAWVRPDLDLSRYSQVYFLPVAIQFRDVPDRRHTIRSMETAEAFFVEESRQAQLRELFGEAFFQAMESIESYQRSEEVGRDVLLIRGLLTDVISGVPPTIPGSVVSTIRWAWETNIVLELRDSMSDDVLARTADRQRVDGPFDAGMVVAVTPRAVEDWSRILIERLEELTNHSRQ